jgi:hypothetical protein
VQDFSLHHSVQTDSEAHPASYPMGTGGSFPEGHDGREVKLTTRLHLVPWPRKVELYLDAPISLQLSTWVTFFCYRNEFRKHCYYRAVSSSVSDTLHYAWKVKRVAHRGPMHGYPNLEVSFWDCQAHKEGQHYISYRTRVWTYKLR